uniref:Lipocalin/cytosolic fatty-acid binding domain-containing protein n=1 Tax=Amblyomma maculatum TaxID=34609 RepID=G3MQ64_AMBMU
MTSCLRLPLSLLGVLCLCLATTPVFTSQECNQPGSEVPDAFKIFSQFLDVAAVLDTNANPIFKCLTATRISFDEEIPEATYRWTLNVHGSDEMKYPLVHYTPASTPDTVHTVINSDTSHSTISRFLYTDCETCAILQAQSFGPQCTLWVRPDLRDSIPKKCINKYTELCGEGVSLYDKETCREELA